MSQQQLCGAQLETEGIWPSCPGCPERPGTLRAGWETDQNPAPRGQGEATWIFSECQMHRTFPGGRLPYCTAPAPSSFFSLRIQLALGSLQCEEDTERGGEPAPTPRGRGAVADAYTMLALQKSTHLSQQHSLTPWESTAADAATRTLL